MGRASAELVVEDRAGRSGYAPIGALTRTTTSVSGVFRFASASFRSFQSAPVIRVSPRPSRCNALYALHSIAE